VTSEVTPLSRTPASRAIGEVLDLFHDRSYLKLLSKSISTGAAVGIIARRVPAIALPVALLGGMYVGLEMARWITEQHEQHEIGPYIDTESLEQEHGEPEGE
jgi:hypothetical protein